MNINSCDLEDTDKKLLRETGKKIATVLGLHCVNTDLEIRISPNLAKTFTNGWSFTIGVWDEFECKLEIWLDNFTGYRDKNFYAGFHSEKKDSISVLVKRVSAKLWPCRTITEKDLIDNQFRRLTIPLKDNEFNSPILEIYKNKGDDAYFGVYDFALNRSQESIGNFCQRAVVFFQEVIRSTQNDQFNPEVEQQNVFPKYENRKIISLHVRRERDTLLSNDRKKIDNYICTVCGMSFKNLYGEELGHNFAEAHHLTPLNTLKNEVLSTLADLCTVCSNCHSMLHRMDGKPSDVEKLKAIVLNNKKSVN
jgi:hypothetical protein